MQDKKTRVKHIDQNFCLIPIQRQVNIFVLFSIKTIYVLVEKNAL